MQILKIRDVLEEMSVRRDEAQATLLKRPSNSKYGHLTDKN
jgi:hypothetical protein